MADRVRKPEWLKINIGANNRYTETKRIVDSHCLHTICSSGRCPNMGECWGKGTATFMIGGTSVPVAANSVIRKPDARIRWIPTSPRMWQSLSPS